MVSFFLAHWISSTYYCQHQQVQSSIVFMAFEVQIRKEHPSSSSGWIQESETDGKTWAAMWREGGWKSIKALPVSTSTGYRIPFMWRKHRIKKDAACCFWVFHFWCIFLYLLLIVNISFCGSIYSTIFLPSSGLFCLRPTLFDMVNPRINLPIGDGSNHTLFQHYFWQTWGWSMIGFTTFAGWQLVFKQASRALHFQHP